ncbi:MAG TPA: hypothetical protein VIL55_03780, partial [Naasia sp.]
TGELHEWRGDFTPRFNRLETGDFTIDADDPLRVFLDAPGARVRCLYGDEQQVSGPVQFVEGSLTPDGEVTYSVEGDWRLLQNTLVWVLPDGNLTPVSLSDEAQGIGGRAHYIFPLGVDSAEHVIKHLITVNAVTRLGRPVTVLPNLNRGGNARAAGMLPEARFSTLEEAVADVLAWSGLGLRIWHDGVTPGLLVDVYEPTVWGVPLSVESGVIEPDGKFSTAAPDATRLILGGPGEESARIFWSVADTALEDEWSDVVEVFRDATGAQLEWPDGLAQEEQIPRTFLHRPDVPQAAKNDLIGYLNAAGRKGLEEGAPTAGLSLQLAETETFHYGGPTGVHLGDVLPVTVSGVPFQDHITEVTIAWGPEGCTVTPQLGQRTDDPDEQLAEDLARVQANQRRAAAER